MKSKFQWFAGEKKEILFDCTKGPGGTRGKTMRVAIYTLGCKVNQYETQAMEQKLLAMGHTLGSFDEPCDCYVINTCTVTAVADKKNRGIIRPRPL